MVSYRADRVEYHFNWNYSDSSILLVQHNIEVLCDLVSLLNPKPMLNISSMMDAMEPHYAETLVSSAELYVDRELYGIVKNNFKVHAILSCVSTRSMRFVPNGPNSCLDLVLTSKHHQNKGMQISQTGCTKMSH